MGNSWDYAIVTALMLSGVQMQAPWLRTALGQYRTQLQSFGGGIGLAYIFLQLFPEINHAHDWMGDHVHVVILGSFLAFFSLETLLIVRTRRIAKGAIDDAGAAEAAPVLWLHICILCFYLFMVVFTLPDDISGDIVFAAAGGLALGIHCVYKDYVMRAHAAGQLRTAGQVALVLAPLLGWLAHVLLRPSEAVLDLFIAMLAGVLMQSVFRDEIPHPSVASVGWVLVGVGVFALLAFL